MRTERRHEMHGSEVRDVLGKQSWDRMKRMRVNMVECVTQWTYPVLQTTALTIIEPKRHTHAQQQE